MNKEFEFAYMTVMMCVVVAIGFSWFNMATESNPMYELAVLYVLCVIGTVVAGIMSKRGRTWQRG